MIKTYFESFKFNTSIKSFWSKAIDQKLQADAISLVAESIIANDLSFFSIRDIYTCDFFVKNIQKRFNKSHPQEIPREVDKFVAQPICFMFVTGILGCKNWDSRNREFFINESEILELISSNDQKSLEFLTLANLRLLDLMPFKKELIKYIRLSKPTQTDLQDIRNFFYEFIYENTEIKNKAEPPRKFNPFINVISYYFKGWGTVGGRPSIIYGDELRYNRRNFRDRNKPKNISRANAEALAEIKQQPQYYESKLARVKDEIKQDNKYSAVYTNIENVLSSTNFKNDVNQIIDEMKDREKIGIHTHHIFPANEFPELSLVKENLIRLNANQHLLFSHPFGKTGVIDRNYQKLLLLIQLSEIEKDLDNDIKRYDLREFIDVLNVGFSTDLFNEHDSVNTTREKLENYLFQNNV